MGLWVGVYWVEVMGCYREGSQGGTSQCSSSKENYAGVSDAGLNESYGLF